MGSIFLVRHATTRASASGTNLGQADDAALTADGDRLAARVGAAIALELAALPHDEIRVISSPALRCRATAAAIAGELGVEADPRSIEIEEGLRELDYGAWEGLTADECRRRDPELRARWEADPYQTHSPGGESGADVAARAFPVLERIEAWLAAGPTRAAIVVSHNHVIRLRMAAQLGIPPSDYRRRLLIEPGSYSLVTLAAGDRVPAVRRIGVSTPAPRE
ncbi:MAG TPA: histidine phosphatase family protein [Candidatus Limnocylindria bacterium]|nr:histidine phosphatase family protein [Candidatus Limnocylindria bacterium]